MAIKMKANRRFVRETKEGVFEYKPGDLYEVPSQEWVEFDKVTGRGEPVVSKSNKED